MALRKIRVDDDEILRKKSRKIEKIDDRIKELADDMVETMYENDGVGLAAPQIGMLKQIVVIDIGEGINILINPTIVDQEGEIIDVEGCLSVTKYLGRVKRPTKVKVQAKNIKGDDIEFEAEGLFARAICHELDHLKGVLFTDKAEEIIDKADLEGEQI